MITTANQLFALFIRQQVYSHLLVHDASGNTRPMAKVGVKGIEYRKRDDMIDYGGMAPSTSAVVGASAAEASSDYDEGPSATCGECMASNVWFCDHAETAISSGGFYYIYELY